MITKSKISHKFCLYQNFAGPKERSMPGCNIAYRGLVPIDRQLSFDFFFQLFLSSLWIWFSFSRDHQRQWTFCFFFFCMFYSFFVFTFVATLFVSSSIESMLSNPFVSQSNRSLVQVQKFFRDFNWKPLLLNNIQNYIKAPNGHFMFTVCLKHTYAYHTHTLIYTHT